MQVVSGIRSILSHPAIYTLLQTMMGARSGWRNFAAHDIKPFPGMHVLDIGCGPAEILQFLPDVHFWGFDISEDYITRARQRFGSKGLFTAKVLTRDDLVSLPQFDVVIGYGLLHHLDDAEAVEVMQLAFTALKRGGRFLTLDAAYEPGQNPIARFLISKDRGQNVRDAHGYAELAKRVFSDVEISIRHKAWPPYTHCFMACTRNSESATGHSESVTDASGVI